MNATGLAQHSTILHDLWMCKLLQNIPSSLPCPHEHCTKNKGVQPSKAVFTSPMHEEPYLKADSLQGQISMPST